MKVAAEKYNSDYEFVDYRLMDEIGHYIRSVMSKLYSDISEKNLNKRKSKGEKKLATKTKGADSSVTSGIRRRSKDRGTQKAAERTAALLRRFKR